MCDKDYENHVMHKYRLAVAISVIKNKPENLTLDQYVELIKTKLTNTFNDAEKDDICSVNSDDFDMSNNNNENYESETQDRPSNMKIDLEKDIQLVNNELSKDNSALNKLQSNVLNSNNLEENITSHPIAKDSTDGQIGQNDTQIEVLNESLNILQDYNNPMEDVVEEMEKSQVLTNVLTILQSVDKEIDDLRHSIQPIEANSQYATLNSENPLQINEINTQKDILDLDSQATIQYKYINTDNFTHISQSQTENIVIEKQYIVSKDRLNETVEINKDLSNTVAKDNSLLMQENGELNNNDDSKINSCEYNNLDVNTRNDECMEENNETEDLLENDQALNESSQSERIPFKIIEEMSKVKILLNRRQRKMSSDGYSTDSGYRSDSQKSFRNSLHISDNWLDQSGCSLLRHVAQSPLMTSTHEINDEIAQVLGQLVDRLQEEEKCPTFLEEILENVDLLLKNIHEGSSGEETALTNKDENMHRLLLFNKSIHIQKYTISKITSILEVKHQKFTSVDIIHEIENIDQVENLCYLFHVLEILLQKYVKNKNMSQTSQSSQNEEKFPRRSTITDIWRRKWNSASKESLENAGSCEKICVLTKCRDVLNKLIVDCMNGYSLVAFSALQCFNLLQN